MKAPLLTAFASGLFLVSVATPAVAGPPVVYPVPYGQGASVPVYTQDTRKERMRRELDVLQQRLEEQRIREGLRNPSTQENLDSVERLRRELKQD